MTQVMPPQFDPENLKQLPTEELVAIILEQQRLIEQLTQAVNAFQGRLHLDSQTSSKPPSTDLLKKPEKAKAKEQPGAETPKRKPGGQPGHPGKTRKGFGRVDRYEVLRPQQCPHCGNFEFATEPKSFASAASSATGRASHRDCGISAAELSMCPLWSDAHSFMAGKCRAWPRSGSQPTGMASLVRELRSSAIRKTARTVAGTRWH